MLWIARLHQPRALVVMDKGCLGAENTQHMLMAVYAAEVRGNAPCHPAFKMQRCGGEVVVIERAAVGAYAVSRCRHAMRSLSRKPSNQVYQMYAAAQHHRVIIDLAAPLLGDFMQPSI